VSGIVKMQGRQRLIELAQQERIAAIQRGIDPNQLPPLPLEALGSSDSPFLSPYESDRRRSQGFLTSGIITLFGGAGILVFLMLIDPDHDKPVWAVGLIPMLVGVSLMLSAWVIRPRGNGGSKA
jgi:VIT1/CCC1 family predicted Fe2+/Mn2+ transporter